MGPGLGTRVVALGENDVYFTDADGITGYIKRVTKTGGAMTTLARTDPSADQLHVDACISTGRPGSPPGRLFGGCRSRAENRARSGTCSISAQPPPVGGLAIDDTSIYFTVFQNEATDLGTVYRGVKDGSAFTAIATGVDEGGYLSAADPDFLYFGIGLFHSGGYQKIHVGKIAYACCDHLHSGHGIAYECRVHELFEANDESAPYDEVMGDAHPERPTGCFVSGGVPGQHLRIAHALETRDQADAAVGLPRRRRTGKMYVPNCVKEADGCVHLVWFLARSPRRCSGRRRSWSLSTDAACE